MSYSEVVLVAILIAIIIGDWCAYVEAQRRHEDIIAWLKAINQTLREKK